MRRVVRDLDLEDARPSCEKRIVTPEQARRIAVRAQLLDGSAAKVLDTIRHLGFLQINPIATVATPQRLVLFSRVGPFDPAELDRLMWKRRKLFEYDAFIYRSRTPAPARADGAPAPRWHRRPACLGARVHEDERAL